MRKTRLWEIRWFSSVALGSNKQKPLPYAYRLPCISFFWLLWQIVANVVRNKTIYSCTDLEAQTGLLYRYGQGPAPSRGSKGEFISLPFPASRTYSISLLSSCIIKASNITSLNHCLPLSHCLTCCSGLCTLLSKNLYDCIWSQPG